MSYRTASDGLWTVLLIPLAIYMQDVDRVYKPILMIITFHSVIISLFHAMKMDFQVLLPKIQSVNLIFSFLTLVFCIDRGGSPYLFFSYVAINYAFPYMFFGLVKLAPKSFTIGEVIIVCQAFFFTFWAATINLLNSPRSFHQLSHTYITVFFSHVGFLLCMLICRFVLLIQDVWTISILDLTFCTWAVGSIGAFWANRSSRELYYLIDWLFLLVTNETGGKLILFWLFLTAAAIGFVFLKNATSASANTIDRKYFHFLIVFVFVPGILMDFSLIYIASVAATCAFLILELIRLLRVSFFNIPVGDLIENGVQIFRDAQDEGSTILTPIYLLAGASLPLWLNLVGPSNNVSVRLSQNVAACLSGVLSIGIGDTFASIGGSKFGKHKWKDSNKSIEGTICSIISQLLFIAALSYSGFVIFTNRTIIVLVLAAVINSLVEAKTDQIDNLILPLLTYNLIVGLPKLHDLLIQAHYDNYFYV